ncbi:MAG: glycosyltransferase [Parachlamydiaceae bacterium]
MKFLIVVACVCFVEVQANIRMGIISDYLYCGERELGWRIKIAAESLGWEVFLDETQGVKLQKIKNLDWVICILPGNNNLHQDTYNYLTIFHPFNYLEKNGNLIPYYEKYDGYLLTIEKPKNFDYFFKKSKKKLFSIRFYPTTYDVVYKKAVLNNLVTMIPVWSDRLTDNKYKNLYTLLSQSGFAKFYGIHENTDIIKDGFMGQIPFDGISVINILQQHGIVLIMHSAIHNQESIPSSRIFEAAAASCVIISDENPFVKKHFGDSVFYIDTSLSAEEIYAQISRYMDMIRSNPDRALEKAKQAHKIFIDNFLMADQLLRLETMHQQVKQSGKPKIKTKK